MIHKLPETGSTNADLIARLLAGETVPEGDWRVADRQTAGRGRVGREWLDGAGNFMGSTVVDLLPSDRLPQTLSLVAGIALFRAVEAVAPAIAGLQLKWPNDLLLDQAKLGGILLERIGNAVVVGIGINVASAPALPGRATTSLADAGFPVSRNELAEELAWSWQDVLRRWHGGEWDALRQSWLKRAHPVGTVLTTTQASNPPLTGTFAGLCADGALQLLLADGTTGTIHAGEINLASRPEE